MPTSDEKNLGPKIKLNINSALRSNGSFIVDSVIWLFLIMPTFFEAQLVEVLYVLSTFTASIFFDFFSCFLDCYHDAKDQEKKYHQPPHV